MDKHQRGTNSLLLAAAHFIQKGCFISLPLTDFGKYDLVIDTGRKLLRAQVKTIYWDNSKKRHLISCVISHIRGRGRRQNKKYDKDSFDLLVGVEPETYAVYEIPIEKIVGRRSITLYPTGKPKTVNTRYKDFEEFRTR